MIRKFLLLAAAALAFNAHAAERIKIGFISTLSGPSAALGVAIRDGFQLAVKMNGGKLGGLPAEVLDGIPEAQRMRLPMRPDSRSLNLSNAVAVAVYEAWRQLGFDGAID